MSKYQFVFQGGGAKLGVLIAAAEAVYAQSIANRFQITGVSGTSAGAIAACIVATGEDPAVFRKQIEKLAPEFLPKICVENGPLATFYKIINGKPLYRTKAYRKFLEELFTLEAKKFVHLSDLSHSIDVFIHCLDLRTGIERVYTRNDTVTIADAIIDSSAIPFYFRTFRSDSKILDGGLTNNFPSDVLLGSRRTTHGPVIGFSFSKGRDSKDSDTLSGFIGDILSAVIDVSAEKSVAKLPREAVHFFRTQTGTFDFKKGFNEDLRGETFRRYNLEAKQFIDQAVAKYRMWLARVDNLEMHKRIATLHKTLSHGRKVKVSKAELVYTSNSLKERNPARRDEFSYSLQLIPLNKRLYSFGVRVTSGESTIVSDVNVSVFGERGDAISATIIPLRVDAIEATECNLLIFFHDPLEAGGEYRINVSMETDEVLYDLHTDRRRDSITYLTRTIDEIDELVMVVFLPRWLNEPTLSPGRGPLPEGMCWLEGSSVSGAEIQKTCRVPVPAGFYPVGWRSRNVTRGQACGFVAFAS